MDAAPSTGPMPDLSDTSTRGGSVIAMFVVMLSLSTTAVALRFYTRSRLLNILGTDDWLILGAWFFSVGVTIGFIRQTFSALGHHVWNVTFEQSMALSMESWYAFVFYVLSLACSKTSILVLYLRILVHGPMRRANYALLGLVMLCNIWALIAQFIQCVPLQALWDPRIEGWCLGLTTVLGNAILHIITDFMIFLLPMPVLVKLKLRKKQKILLVGVFALGFLLCLISILRLLSFKRLDTSTDPTWDLAIGAYWGAAEVNLAIVCACLTTLKPLLAKILPRLMGSTHGTELAGQPSAGYGQQSTRQTLRRVPAEQLAFSKLQDDAPDSASAASVSSNRAYYPMYDLEGQPERRSDIRTPTKAYERQGL